MTRGCYSDATDRLSADPASAVHILHIRLIVVINKIIAICINKYYIRWIFNII